MQTQHASQYCRSLGNQVVLGMENGMIRIQTLDNEGGKRKHVPDSSQADFSTFGPYWVLSVHDNNYGLVQDVKMSADDRFLFTCGGDGNMFAFEIMNQEKIEESQRVARAKIPSAKVRVISKAGKNAQFPRNKSQNFPSKMLIFCKFPEICVKKDQNIHLNDKFPLKIANISLQSQKIPHFPMHGHQKWKQKQAMFQWNIIEMQNQHEHICTCWIKLLLGKDKNRYKIHILNDNCYLKICSKEWKFLAIFHF